jgi:X-X-X-Leu-X-X-Gly heptad repeat protein
VAAFEGKANALKKAVAEGKADGASALDSALGSLADGAKQLKDTVAAADVDAARATVRGSKAEATQRDLVVLGSWLLWSAACT